MPQRLNKTIEHIKGDLDYKNNLKLLNKINLQFHMSLLHSSKAYVFNLQTTSSAEAKRLWRKDIKEKWNWQCAYCGDDSNLTIDHVVPRCKGGTDFTKNVVCCCNKCNQRKGHGVQEIMDGIILLSPERELDRINLKHMLMGYLKLRQQILQIT